MCASKQTPLKMEEDAEQDTKLTLYFPDNYDDSIAKCLEYAEKRYAVIGEVIDIIVIAEYEGENSEAKISEWRQKIESLQTLATVSPSVSSAENEKDFQFKNHKNTNIHCQAIYSYKEDPLKKLSEPLLKVNRELVLWSEDDKWTSLSRTNLACVERVSLDSVPANCAECSISVALWLPLMESSTSSSSNILESFLKYSPEVIMHQQLGKCIQQSVVKSISLIPVPMFTCRHFSAGGKNLISLTVANHHPSSLVLCNVRVHPTIKEAFTSPISEASSMTDSATIESDSGENNESIKVSRSGKNNNPATLNPLEVMTCTFSVQVNESIGVSDQGQAIYLLAIVTWTKADVEDRIITHYRLPTLQVRKPSLVITAIPVNESSPKEVQVKFTVVNNLQDFSSLRFIWSPEKALQESRAKENEAYRRSVQNVIKSVVCCDPSVHLGACKVGTVVTAVVGFKILTPGVYEVGQHMKLKLQYQNSSSMPGHQRKGSITSTHSMPAEPRRDIHPTVTTRSASMCPLSEQETGGGRRGSITSTHSFTPTWTPPDSSPAHIPAATLHRNSSHGNLTSGSTFKPHHNRVPSYGSYIVTPSSRPSSAVSSPSRPMPVVSSAQVLKRNCQVYYQQTEVDPA